MEVECRVTGITTRGSVGEAGIAGVLVAIVVAE